ncbi:MAG: hypothetical protein ABIZ52_01985 [Candidatus Limnocylindrales bacterium]
MAPDGLVALVAHARDVPAAEREAFATRLRDVSDRGAVVVQTCHRVEAYLVSSPDDAQVPAWLPSGGRSLIGEAAIRHAISVAVGRDSVVVGEDQILHQVREAIERARAEGRLDPVLERLFGLGLRAGRRARSWRAGPARSLADVVVALIERRAGPLAGREVLIVGAGAMGRLAVRAVVGVGAAAAIANRSATQAAAVAADTGARVDAFDPGPTIDRFAAVIIALRGPWLIGKTTADALVGSATVAADLSVPAAVPLDLARRLGTRLLSIDDLVPAEADIEAGSDRSLTRLDALIEATAAEFTAWLEGRDGRAAAAVLAARADAERHAALEILWRQMPELDADARTAIERMSRHLAERLLGEPLARLGRDVDGRHEQAAKELFGL